MSLTGDGLYEVAYRTCWDHPSVLGHVVIRRLDDHEIVAEIPATTPAQAESLLERAALEVRGPADAFEAAWGITGVVTPPLEPTPQRRAEDECQLDEGREVVEPDTSLVIFPEPTEVFVADQQWLAELLHPLVSVDLAAINPEWSGSAHFLSPVEPESGLLGEDSPEHASGFARENWLTFRLENGRYRYLGERELFQRENPTAPQGGLAEHYERAEAEFAAAKRRWDRIGHLTWGDKDDLERVRPGWEGPTSIIDQLGGEPGYGNWASFPPPAALRLDETDEISPTLRLADGRPFSFIGATAGYPWRDSGADAILVFFEPVTQTTAMTFDWT